MFIESRIFVETVEICLTWVELSRPHFFGWYCLKTVELGRAKSSRVLSDEKVEIHRNLVETVKIYAKMFRTKHTELWPRLSKIAVSTSTRFTIFFFNMPSLFHSNSLWATIPTDLEPIIIYCFFLNWFYRPFYKRCLVNLKESVKTELSKGYYVG